MNQTPPISPVVKLKLKQLDDKKLLEQNSLNSASSKLQSLLERERDNDEGTNPSPVVLNSMETEKTIPDKLSALISQLIPLHNNNSSVTLASESISSIISVLDVTVTYLQHQENALNLLKLNTDIIEEQSVVEKEMLSREIEMMRSIQDRQRKDLAVRNRRNSEPVRVSKKRTLRAPRSTRKMTRKQQEAVESDQTISENENDADTEDEDEVSGGRKFNRTTIIAENTNRRNQEYDRLINDISKNQKLFLHNKFGYYYNTLNENKNAHRRSRRSISTSKR